MQIQDTSEQGHSTVHRAETDTPPAELAKGKSGVQTQVIEKQILLEGELDPGSTHS